MRTPSLSDLALVVGAVVVAVVMSLATEDGVTPANVLFGSILVALLLLGVRAAVRGSRRAIAQRREADRLAAASPTEAVVRAVRAESERLYADVRSTLRVALDAIAAAATRARAVTPGESSAGDAAAIEQLRAVQRHARVATTELRRMLGLLRADDLRDGEVGELGTGARGGESEGLHADGVDGPRSDAVDRRRADEHRAGDPRAVELRAGDPRADGAGAGRADARGRDELRARDERRADDLRAPAGRRAEIRGVDDRTVASASASASRPRTRADVPSWPPALGWILLCGLLLAEFLYFAVVWEGGLVHDVGQTVPRAVIQIALTCLAAVIFLAPLEVTFASALTAAVFALGLVIDAPVVLDVWAIVTFGVLTWRTLARPARQPWACLAFAVLVAVVLVGEARADRGNLWFIAVFFAVAVVIALIARVADAIHASARRRAVSAEESMSATTDAALRRHRLEVGRDLHDALSGTIGVIVTQAGAAELLWRTDPRRAVEALAVVAASVDHARADLDQLASLVAPGERPARGLADVPELVERLRAAGLDVRLSPELPVVEGEADAAAYRIIQECLSNAALHSPGSRVEASVLASDGWLCIVVADDGPGPVAPARGGYGLVGLRERATQLGGRVSVDADAAGFRVTAELPLAAEVPA